MTVPWCLFLVLVAQRRCCEPASRRPNPINRVPVRDRSELGLCIRRVSVLLLYRIIRVTGIQRPVSYICTDWSAEAQSEGRV